jgi:hypothetical protein
MPNGWNPFRKKCITRMPYKIVSPLTEVLLPGDIILYRAWGYQIMGGLITDFTKSPYSHAEIYTGDGWSIEAGARGVSFNNAFHTNIVDILRWKSGLSNDQRRVIIGKAYQSLAKPYEYLLLLGFPFISRKAAIQRAANQAFVCSEIVAWCYGEAGLKVCENMKPTSVRAPADFGLSKNFEWIGFYHNAEKVLDGERNVWHMIQGKRNCFARFVIEFLINPLTKKDEYYNDQLKQSQELAAKGYRAHPMRSPG